MNLRTLAESFTLTELNELSIHIANIRKEIIRGNVKEYPQITMEEALMIKFGNYIDAIKSYKGRTGLSLLEAKTVIDVIREESKR